MDKEEVQSIRRSSRNKRSSVSEHDSAGPTTMVSELKKNNKKKKLSSIPDPVKENIVLEQNRSDEDVSPSEMNLEQQETISILNFPFKKKRVKILSDNVVNVKHPSNGIVYWMSRDMRVKDNWALLYAQKLCLKNHLPLYVCYCLVPTFLQATYRHYKFMLEGLQEVETELNQLNIQFHVLSGESPVTELTKFIEKFQVGCLICDFSPLRISKQWREELVNTIPKDIPFCQVDAHNIVPIWITSNKQEFSARTIRSKINEQLSNYLTEFPTIVLHPYSAIAQHAEPKYSSNINWTALLNSLNLDEVGNEIQWAKGGYTNGIKMLNDFCKYRLKDYDIARNDPVKNATSNLSPWFHFGQISIQRCIKIVQSYRSKYPKSVDAFCEETIVRRELADNFCFYNENYDNINGLADWAKNSLIKHTTDKRQYIYTRDEFENYQTHDDLWNAAQCQLITEAKMHGFLRMYWAKKILEWTRTPQEALEIAIYLNDRYSLDGRDPNGYVGCMWSIGGVHDMGWKEREIFGKIRYMNYKGCLRKFDVKSFVNKYSGGQE